MILLFCGIGFLVFFLFFFFKYILPRGLRNIKFDSFFFSCLAIIGTFFLISMLGIIPVQRPLLIYLIYLLLFLSLGILNVLIHAQKKEKGILWSLLVLLMTFSMGYLLFSTVHIYFSPKELRQCYLGSALMFFVPYSFSLTLLFWKNIPKLSPIPWVYNETFVPGPIPDTQDWVAFVFRVANVDYNVNIPRRYRVGDTFHRVVEENFHTQNEIKISQVDKNGNTESIGWYFIASDAKNQRNKHIDWTQTFENNQIKDGDIIWGREQP